MTQNSAQNPEDQAACQSGGQQTSAEGAHAQSGQQAAKAVSHRPLRAPQPTHHRPRAQPPRLPVR